MEALIFPFLLIVFILIAILALFLRRFFLFIIFFLISLVSNNWIEFFSLTSKSGSILDETKNIKVLCFNLKSSQEYFEDNRPFIVDFLFKENADILFLSEFYANRTYNLLPILAERYPFIGAKEGKGILSSSIFLSKYPIVECEKIEVEKNIIIKEFSIDEDSLSKNNTKHNSIYKTSFDIDGQQLSIIGTHLIGNNFYSNTESYSIDSINSFGYLKSYLKNVHESYRYRALQADAVCEAIDSISSPLIVMGDMNDIGGSYTIRSLENKGLEDAWWNGGWGYGTTFEQGWLKLRLDHILYSPKSLKLRSIKTIDTGMSDHKCLVAEFELCIY